MWKEWEIYFSQCTLPGWVISSHNIPAVFLTIFVCYKSIAKKSWYVNVRFGVPFKLNGIRRCWQFSLGFEIKRIPFGFKTKGNLILFNFKRNANQIPWVNCFRCANCCRNKILSHKANKTFATGTNTVSWFETFVLFSSHQSSCSGMLENYLFYENFI